MKMEKIDHILEMILMDDSPMDAEGHTDAAQANRAITIAKVRSMKRWSLFFGGGDYRMIEQPERGEYVKFEEADAIISGLSDELLCMSEALSAAATLETTDGEDWKLNCQYLLDILDNQGFMSSDLGEEDEAEIEGIRSALAAALPRHPERNDNAE